MPFSLFSNKPLLDPEAEQWLFDAFHWTLTHFDSGIFWQHTQLVLPDNRFFPGKADSADAMARLILDQVKDYAALTHWPTRLVDASQSAIKTCAPVQIEGPMREIDGSIDDKVPARLRLPIHYLPQMVTSPEAIIASFAHTLAHHLGLLAAEPPPGGSDYWPQATELLAVHLGFGLMFANSAFTFRGGCGSCHNSAVGRDAYLSELETSYALALFCVLKAIPASTATPYLKGHLRGFFKKACKAVAADRRLEQLQAL